MTTPTATLAGRDPHQRGILWFYGFDAPPGAWEPVVFLRSGNKSLGRYQDAYDATRAWHAAMDCPEDIQLPEGWTWERVMERRARYGIEPCMVPVATAPGCVAWGHVNFERNRLIGRRAA